MRLRYQVLDEAGNGVGIRAPIIARASNLGWGTQPEDEHLCSQLAWLMVGSPPVSQESAPDRSRAGCSRARLQLHVGPGGAGTIGPGLSYQSWGTLPRR